MVIVVEEKKTSAASLLNIIGWLLILVLIIGATYYIFFQDPTVITYQASPELSNIGLVSRIQDDLDINKLKLPQGSEHLVIPPVDAALRGQENRNPFQGFGGFAPLTQPRTTR